MKKKLFAVLFAVVLVLSVSGCDKKESVKKIEVKGPRVVCSYTEEDDGIKTENTVTLKFNSENYVNYQVIESTMTFDKKDTYNSYVETMKDTDTEFGEHVKYEYSTNDKKKQISSSLIYEEGLFDYTIAPEEEKENYLASNILKKYEDNKITCKYIETSKKDLGVE